MRTDRLFVPSESIDRGQRKVEIKDAGQTRQLANVLRLRPGDRLEVMDGKGNLFKCTLVEIARRTGCTLHIDSEHDATDGEAKIDLTVALSILKGDRFDWAVEKLTEIGVNRIVPLLAERTVVRTGQDNAKVLRWRNIAREAAEQCERAVIPEVVPPTSLTHAMAQATAGSTGELLLCMERSVDLSIHDFLTRRHTTGSAAPLTVLIGPEGGFTDSECSLARANGATAISLGRRILRAETASVCAASIIMSHLDK